MRRLASLLAPCIILAGLLFVPAAGLSESTLNRAYSWDKLDGFWQATLGSAPPDVAAFDVFAASDTPEPVSAPVPDFGVPMIGEILGESAPEAGGMRLGFPVIPLGAAEAGALMRRVAWAELYLARLPFFVSGTQDSAAEIDALTPRQLAAATEAYLTHARLYFAAPDLVEKCSRLTRMAQLEAGALETLGAAELPPDWAALAPLMAAARDRLGDDALVDLVCSFEPVRGRAETVTRITTRVRERLAREATAKVDEALVLLSAAAEEFTALVAAMDVEIRTAEILDLERAFGDAAANIRLVQNDQLKADETLEELEAVDLSTLNQPGEMAEYQAAEGQMAAMIALLDATLTELAALAPLAPDGALADCEGLEAVYDAPDLSRDSFALTASIEGPYVTCLAAARRLVEAGNAVSLETVLIAALARHVGQISSNLLEELQ